MTAPLIRSDMLIFALRSELDEQRFAHKVLIASVTSDDSEIAHSTGYIEALTWCLEQVELRARKAA